MAIALIAAHAEVVSAVTQRSSVDFRPMTLLVEQVGGALAKAFEPATGDLPPSLATELAPVLAPRLERLLHAIRQRLARARRLLPLHVLREMDPACLRVNSRRPGKDLAEKAGPHQELWGVVRVAKYDTMENRVLAAACRYLLEICKEQISRTGVVRTGDAPRYRTVLRLKRAAEALLESPELVTVGLPRPGERPSNALLGDADYRAAWRAWQLLRKQEEAYRAQWNHLERVWADTCLLAAWAVMDAHADFEQIPSWVRAVDGAEHGLSLESSAERCWVSVHGGVAEVLAIRRSQECIEFIRRSSSLEPGAKPTKRVVDTALSLLPGDDWLTRARAAVAATLPEPRPWTQPGRRPVPGLVGISVLDAVARACDESGTKPLGPTAAGNLSTAACDPMAVRGRSATWLPEAHGPAELFSTQAQAAGAFLTEFKGTHETAFVVPDTLDELVLTRIRTGLGRAWSIWSPVAAALAAAEAHGVEIEAALRGSRHLLVVVATDAAFDVAVLELDFEPQEDGGGPNLQRRFWIRSEPLPGDATGRQPAGLSEREGVMGAWLRNPGETQGWAVVAGYPQHTQWGEGRTICADDVRERLRGWRGEAPTMALVVGLDDASIAELGRTWPMLSLDQDALARGALAFLRRRAEGLPTWKDRLPEVAVEARVDRLRVQIPLIAKGTLVAPGQSLRIRPRHELEIPHGVPRIVFGITRESRNVPYSFVIDGPPLPLGQPCRVRVELDYRYGLDGMSGSIVSIDHGLFERLPFHLSVAERTVEEQGEEVGPPPLQAMQPIPAATAATIRSAFEAVHEKWKKVPDREQRASSSNSQVFDNFVRPGIRSLNEALKVLGGIGPTEDDPFRPFMEKTVVPWLDWLAGLGKGDGRGRPPQLTPDSLNLVARCRAATGLRGDGRFSAWVQSNSCRLQAVERLAALGRTVEGKAGPEWTALVEWPCDSRTQRQNWAEAIDVALRARPSLAALDIRMSIVILEACVAELLALVDDGTALSVANNKVVYAFIAPIPWLCLARAGSSGFGPGEKAVASAADALRNAQGKLPAEVRKFAQRTFIVKDDEPISVAIDYLCGKYAQLPGQRSR